jgi:ABC-2 type transport system ATP-binding protein
MSDWVVDCDGVAKAYRFFELRHVSLQVPAGHIVGLVGPNGAGKSTLMRILMAMVRQDRGVVRVLGRTMPDGQEAAKREIGYVSEDMRLYPNATLDWHMRFVASMVPVWDEDYARTLLGRFDLRSGQVIRAFSHGERVKAALLLALSRRPRLLVLDEPTTGLDPVARHEVLTELLAVVADEERAVLFSSHNTHDVEQISDRIVFMDRGRIIEASDKETFLQRWRRVHLELPPGTEVPTVEGVVQVRTSGKLAVVTARTFAPDLVASLTAGGATVRDVQRMTLEEIFVATVMHSRKEVAA